MSRRSLPPLLPLNEAALCLPGPITSRRLYRWIRLGVRNVYLGCVRDGPFLLTSQNWLERFLDDLGRRVRDHADGEILLREAGL
jgi:hypothetical protein